MKRRRQALTEDAALVDGLDLVCLANATPMYRPIPSCNPSSALDLMGSNCCPWGPRQVRVAACFGGPLANKVTTMHTHQTGGRLS